jgi:response regulator RpfG family c-di-GMP phosphodiesterase
MHRILLVEDDDQFRRAMVMSLKDLKYEVIEAANGKVAREICGTQKFDVVISDVQMPFLDGVELLDWIKKNNPMPFVLMTAFTNILETKTAYELGAEDFLAKPFRQIELKMILDKILRPPSKNAPELGEAESLFCRVSIDEFVSRPKIDFDVYIRLSPNKFIRIGHAGDEIPRDRIENYKQKGQKHLHIRREDFTKLVDFNLELSRVVVKHEQVNVEKKINFMKYTGEVILEKAFVAGVDEESYGEAKEMLVSTVNVMTEIPEHLELLNVLNEHSDWIYAHSVGTAMFSLMIARRMGHTTAGTYFKLGMAGLFHEIGYKEIPREILEKPRPLLSQSERALIESHVTRSYEILSCLRTVPSDVMEIVYQHHEDVLGQGYPRRLEKHRLHPLAKIFQVADQFADVAIKGPHHAGMSGKKAAAYITDLYEDKFDKDSLKALHSVFTA